MYVMIAGCRNCSSYGRYADDNSRPFEDSHPDMWVQKPQMRRPSDPNQSVGCHHVTFHSRMIFRRSREEQSDGESVTYGNLKQKAALGNFALKDAAWNGKMDRMG